VLVWVDCIVKCISYGGLRFKKLGRCWPKILHSVESKKFKQVSVVLCTQTKKEI
jgi:hypothetical protein